MLFKVGSWSPWKTFSIVWLSFSINSPSQLKHAALGCWCDNWRCTTWARSDPGGASPYPGPVDSLCQPLILTLNRENGPPDPPTQHSSNFSVFPPDLESPAGKSTLLCRCAGWRGLWILPAETCLEPPMESTWAVHKQLSWRANILFPLKVSQHFWTSYCSQRNSSWMGWVPLPRARNTLILWIMEGLWQ